jgi:hypothetical protein
LSLNACEGITLVLALAPIPFAHEVRRNIRRVEGEKVIPWLRAAALKPRPVSLAQFDGPVDIPWTHGVASVRRSAIHPILACPGFAAHAVILDILSTLMIDSLKLRHMTAPAWSFRRSRRPSQ